MNMKIRPSVLFFLGIATLVMMLAVWSANRKAGLKSASIPIFSNTNNALLPAGATDSAVLPAKSVPSAGAPISSATNQVSEAKVGLAGLNDVPIKFYGRLEDQFGNPVSAAEIAASVRIYNGVRSTVDRFVLTSDVNGFFEINHGNGESLGLMPHRDGYVLANTNTEFKYSFMYQDHFSPDPNNPTIIKMWKLQGAEPLAGIDLKYKLHYTNAPISFDLLTGQIVESGGDMRLTINRPSGIVSQRNPQDWSIRLEAVDGGLIEASVEQMRITYSAPENDYKSDQTIMVKTNNHWSDIASKAYFVLSRAGHVHGKLEFSFRINDAPDGLMYVSFNGVANMNGSRNWEATAPH